jgi:FMN phosphatase YigB (HAD superfamily)
MRRALVTRLPSAESGRLVDTAPNARLAGYFSGLRPRYRTAILSNSFVGAREREEAAYGFDDICDVVVYSHEAGLKKPDRRFYELVCTRLGVGPREAIFLDDDQAIAELDMKLGVNLSR